MALQSLLSQIKLINSAENREAFKTCISNSYEWLENEFDSTDIESLVTGRAAFVDALLCQIWRVLQLDQDKQLALVAVGGYGRGHLQPHSDVDLLILSKKTLNKQQQESVSSFITTLWDIGLEVGQSVRTIKETFKLAQNDITIATNLIESRLLIGNKEHFQALQDKVQSRYFWSSKDFFLAKYNEQLERHAKFNDTSYNLEPNVKENPGCLRDIQCIGWVAKKHFKVLKGTELVEYGYFTQSELDELIECRMFLWRIRFALHFISGRSENRLLFDYQAELAKKLGYEEQGKSAVEQMMKAFFRTVRRVSELNEMLLQHFKQDILALKVKENVPLNAEFCLRDGLIYPLNNRVFDSPEAILQFFHLVADEPRIAGLHSATLRLLRNARRAFRDHFFCDRPECRTLFIQLVSKVNFFGRAWNLMHRHGIMQAYLPQWNHIVGMMQFDLFHAYTVDEHTHRLIKNLYEFANTEVETRFPRCRRIVTNLDKPELLFLAGIFHDIAKGRGGDHSKLGAEDVRAFCKTHDIAQDDAELIEWLVEKHLLMSVVAQRRDIYDPEVIQEFASTVRNIDYLEHLYALTLADIRATNNNLWNDWKSSLLRELFLMTRKALEDGLENKVDLKARVTEHKDAAMSALLELGHTQEKISPLWEQFPTDYFVRFKPKQIVWHSSSIVEKWINDDNKDDQFLLVDLSDDTAKAGTELMLFGKDRPHLFAQVASVLDSRNCSIQDAQIMTTKDGYIFDSFIILEQDGSHINSPSRLSSLQKAIVAQLDKPGVEHRNHRRMPRQLKQLDVPTKVRFFESQSDITLLELEALDAPGLLAKVGHLFMELNLTLKMAKITTIGERAEDFFVICNADGHALDSQQQIDLKKQIVELLSNQQ